MGSVSNTSLQAYREERLNRRFQPKEICILDNLNIGGPGTRAELAKRTGLKINCLCGRVNRLLELGVIEEFDKVKDPDTNKLVNVLRIKENECHA